MSYKKTLNKDFSGKTYVNQGFSGYYSGCNFSNSTFENCVFECVLWDCNFENVILDRPTVRRLQFFNTGLEGLGLTMKEDCEMSSANLARCHPIIAEVMRQKSLELAPGLKEKALAASKLVGDNLDKCWSYFASKIPKEVWRKSEFGFRDKGSILNKAIMTRDKHFD